MLGELARPESTSLKHRNAVRVAARACVLGALLGGSAAAQQALLVADDATTAAAFARQAGRVLTFVCPSTVTRLRDLWGTDVYDLASPICTAAVHAGRRTSGTTAQVTIRIGAPAEELHGSERNGVTSLPYGRVDFTYSFVDDSEPGQIEWHTSFDRVPDDFSEPITVLCPPNGNRDSTVIGTDVYRSDSAICVAAVHAGVLTTDAGGRVRVTLEPKQSPLAASARYGVSSQAWNDWNYRSYPQPYSVKPSAVLVAVATSPAILAGPREARAGARTPRWEPTAPESERTPYIPGPRTQQVRGFTAQGSAPTIVPRLLSTQGFTGVGSAPASVPRTLATPGWTSTGTAP